MSSYFEWNIFVSLDKPWRTDCRWVCWESVYFTFLNSPIHFPLMITLYHHLELYHFSYFFHVAFKNTDKDMNPRSFHALHSSPSFRQTRKGKEDHLRALGCLVHNIISFYCKHAIPTGLNNTIPSKRIAIFTDNMWKCNTPSPTHTNRGAGVGMRRTGEGRSVSKRGLATNIKTE